MTTTYDTFLPEIMPYVHDVPEFVAINAIRNSAIEFCNRSEVWRYEYPTINSVALQGDYTFSSASLPTTDCEVKRIYQGFYNYTPVIPMSTEDLASIYINQDWRTVAGNPRYVTQKTPATFTLVPGPIVAITAAINLIVVLQPTRTSTGIDDYVYSQWAEHIAAGARARLYDTPNQPYYDPGKAALYHAKFVSAISTAKADRNRGLGRATPKVRPPRFF